MYTGWCPLAQARAASGQKSCDLCPCPLRLQSVTGSAVLHWTDAKHKVPPISYSL